MAIVLEDAQQQIASDVADPRQFNLTVNGTERVVYVMVSRAFSTSTPSSVTVGGVAATLLQSYLGSGQDDGVVFLYQVKDADLAANASQQVSVSFTGTAARFHVSALSLSGVDQSDKALGILLSADGANDLPNGSSPDTRSITPGGFCFNITANEPTKAVNTTNTGQTQLFAVGQADQTNLPSTSSSHGTTLAGMVANCGNPAGRWCHVAASLLEASTGTPPSFEDPSPLQYKVGAVVTENANAWFTGEGSLTYSAETLPAGLSLTGATGEISGTLTQASGNFQASITCTDDAHPGDPTVGEFVWEIEPFRIVFGAGTRLEDQDGNPISTGGLSYSVFTDLTAGQTALVQATGVTTTNPGELVIDLPDTVVASATYTVLLEDADETNTPLGAYERVSQ